MVLKTGWSAFVKEDKYRNEIPGISRELAMWFVDKKINLLVVEPPSVADVLNKEILTDIHEILLGGDIIIVESITNLEALKRDRVTIIALPLKIKDGDGAPARVIALEED